MPGANFALFLADTSQAGNIPVMNYHAVAPLAPRANPAYLRP